tara:strand:- start:250 stop:591 length:342 start_codon:yes stop_codon:yes gene_type:complete
MAFVLKQSDTYKWDVSVDVPVDGQHKRSTFTGEFKRIPQSRIREIGQQIEEGTITDAEMVEEVLVGWDGIDDMKGEPVKFSRTALQQLVDVPMVATCIATAYFESIAGAKRKN